MHKPLAILLSSSDEIARLAKSFKQREHRRLPGEARASVALLLRPLEAGLELLVIRRAARVGDPWSGHMGLPGGRRDSGDGGDLQTAVRETREELGLDLESTAELLGSLDDIQASANGLVIDLVVSAFVFLVGASPSLRLNDEVAEALWVPISVLGDGRCAMTHQVELRGTLRDLPGWDVGGRIIWGLTYRIVSNLLRQIGL